METKEALLHELNNTLNEWGKAVDLLTRPFAENKSEFFANYADDFEQSALEIITQKCVKICEKLALKADPDNCMIWKFVASQAVDSFIDLARVYKDLKGNKNER